MTFKHNPNSGNLRKNDFKKEDKHPDYRGSCVVSPELAGREIDLAAWIKKDKNGKPYMSISFSEPYKKESVQSQPAPPAFDDGSDLPF